MDFQIKPVAVDGYADADGVYENNAGARLGQVVGDRVDPCADEDMDFVAAPDNWRGLIVKEL